MSKYIGTKAVNLSTTSADVTGNADIDGNLTVGGNLTVSGTTITVDHATAQTVDLGDNDKIRLGADYELQLWSDGTTGQISGDINHTGSITTDGLTVDTDTLHVDATNNRVGIGTSSPSGPFHIVDGRDELSFTNGSNNVYLSLTAGFNTKNSVLNFYNTSDAGYGRIDYDHATEYMAFSTNSSEAMRITSDGFVGIGTDAPSTLLHAVAPTNNGATAIIEAAAGYNSRVRILSNVESYLEFGDASDADVGEIVYNHASNYMRFNTNASEAARIDASGNLLVGKDSTAFADEGAKIGAAGESVHFVRASDTPVFIRRNTNEGDLLKFYKDSTAVGAIGTTGTLFYMESTSGAGFRLVDDDMRPSDNGVNADNTFDLGNSNARWRDLYLSRGVLLGGTATANRLEDYEEGEWLPQVEFATVGSTATTSTNTYTTGGYTKIGKAVTVEFNISQINWGNGTGNVRLTGLPFTPSGVPQYTGRSVASSGHLVSAITASGYIDILKVYGVSTYNLLASTGSGSWIHITDSNRATINPNSINGSFTYYTNS